MGQRAKEKVAVASEFMSKSPEYTKSHIARALEFSRSSFYHKPTLDRKDETLAEKIREEHKTDDTLGHKSLAPLVGAGKNRTRRVMLKYEIAARPRKRKYIYPGKTSTVFPNLANNEEISFNRLVVFSDIFQFRLADGCLVYGCFALLKSTRQVLSLVFSYTMEADLVAATISRIDFLDLGEALWHTDQGKQFGSFEVILQLIEKGFIASMSRAGTPTDNPFAERFVGTFKHAVVRRRKYQTLGEFLDAAEIWTNFYNTRRPHQGIGLLSPNKKAAELGLPDVPFISSLTV